MDKSQKWETVGSRRGGSSGKGISSSVSSGHIADRGKTTGLSTSTAPFSQFGERTEEGMEKLPATSAGGEAGGGVEDSFSTSTVVLEHSTIPAMQQSAYKKKSAKKPKPKVKRVPFEECLAELGPEETVKVLEGILTTHQDKPMNILKEIHGHLGNIFSKAEPEKDYVFSTQLPEYPLSALPSKSKGSLLKLVVQCPPLVQEKAFGYFLELLLSELGAGTSSYSTRIMLLLLVQCNSSVCVEKVGLIKVFLDSNISKVPEALSLLWVGLPYPTLHPATAAETWTELCLPLLQRSNVPRQVFSYAVTYSNTLIKYLAQNSADLLLKTLTPTNLSALLTSSQLQKRAQDNVQEMLELAQEVVLKAASEKQLAGYFEAVVMNLSTENLLPVKFAASCLQFSGPSWEVWSGKGPSQQLASSAILLKELSGRDLATPMPHISFERLASMLTKVSQKLPEKDREIAKEVLSLYADAYGDRLKKREARRKGTGVGQSAKQEGERGAWCSGCGLLVALLSLAYLYVLGHFLYHVATEGPERTLETLSVYVNVRDVQSGWRGVAQALNWYCGMLLHYLPQSLHLPQRLVQALTDMTW